MGSHVAVLEVGARETSVIRTPLDSRMDGSIVSSRSMPERSRRLYIGLARASARQYLIITYSYKLETAEVLCVAACCSAPRYVLTFFIFVHSRVYICLKGSLFPYRPSWGAGCSIGCERGWLPPTPQGPSVFRIENGPECNENPVATYQSNLEPVPTERKAQGPRT